jgi:hypothetical protein
LLWRIKGREGRKKEKNEKEISIREKEREKKTELVKKKRERVLWTFHSLIHLLQPREAVLPNVSPKRFQLH